MIRRGLASTIAVLGFAALCAATDLPNQWRAWRYSRAVTFPAGQRSPFTLKLPFDLLARSDAHGSDIRVIDDQGQEVPYALNLLHGNSETRVLPSRLLERSFVPGQFTQIIISVNDKPALDKSHGATLDQIQAEPWFNTYRIVTAESDFMFWVETSVSDDAHQWRVVDARSPISRFRKHGLDGNQSIQIEGYSNQRFLRVRVFDPDRQFAVDSIEVLSRQSTEPPRVIEATRAGCVVTDRRGALTARVCRGGAGSLRTTLSVLRPGTAEQLIASISRSQRSRRARPPRARKAA